MKKLISFLLILATVLSCFVLTVSAGEEMRTDEAYLPFEDVKDSHWFSEAVEFCYANGIIKGMNDYTFGWGGNLTRAQFLTMLATIDGADLTQYSVTKFEDVKSTHWYYGVVAWAYETELTSGVSDTKFGPNQAITRAQIARFMWVYMKDKYAVEVDENCLEQFVDV
ncbi:MAG: S-layer homology domain-containing protein, partial [Clostridia bacterium]|nr:S-layer homology domain-containing protein [Clostridia bacterium]